MATKVNKSAEETKNVVDNFDTPVMDKRIVKLNEIIGIRLASINSKNRPAVKEAKELAKYILANWDDESELLKIKSEDVTNETVQKILSSRLQNFVDAKKACEEAVKELEAPKVYKDKNGKKIKVGSLVKDLSVEGSEPCEVFEDEGELAVNVDGTTVYLSEIETDKVFEIVKKQKVSAKKEEKQPKEKTAKTARKVGDVHPKHPTWVWTEYVEGKFDWRTNPADKKQGQRTDKMKKEEPKKASKASKGTAKQSKKTEPKKESKAESKAPKMLTIDEFRAMPKNKRGKKMSKAQEDALKLISKGYWIWNNEGHYFFKNDSGETKACNMDSVTAMFKRYGLDYIPEGLIK